MSALRENAAAGGQLDFVKGDPAKHIIGPDEEKAARYHAPQKRKPRAPNKPTERSILRSIKQRKADLEPAVQESKLLTEALAALKGI